MAQNWVRHTLERSGWRSQSQATALVILGIMLTLIFGGVYLSQVVSYATTNREIEKLLEERDQLEFQNEQLRAEIANLETVPRLLNRAQELGFTSAAASNIEYLVVDGYNPNRPSSTAATIAIEEALNDDPIYTETFSGWVDQQMDSLRRQFDNFGR